MKLEDALSALGREAGLNTLGFDQDGVCRLVFDQRLVVDLERIEPNNDQAFLYSVVGRIPAQDREALYASLLGAHLFGRETGDATLALDEVAGEILLQQKIDTEHLDTTALVRLVERFVHTLEHWQTQLEQSSADPSGVSAEVQIGAAAMMRV